MVVDDGVSFEENSGLSAGVQFNDYWRGVSEPTTSTQHSTSMLPDGRLKLDLLHTVWCLIDHTRVKRIGWAN